MEEKRKGLERKESFEKATRGLFPESYKEKLRGWLEERYGGEEGEKIWEKVMDNYLAYYKTLPDYGGKKNGHAMAIYGGVLVFAFYEALPDAPPLEELQDFIQHIFLGQFVTLGKIFNLNRSLDMALIDKVFRSSGNRDRRDIQLYPEGFANVDLPYDKENHASRYAFTKCPNAEFAKKHGLLHVLPLLCNCDFFGIAQLHGTLIREGTCGNSSLCDYCVVGDQNPLAQEYELQKDPGGFLVSRRKESK